MVPERTLHLFKARLLGAHIRALEVEVDAALRGGPSARGASERRPSRVASRKRTFAATGTRRGTRRTGRSPSAPRTPPRGRGYRSFSASRHCRSSRRPGRGRSSTDGPPPRALDGGHHPRLVFIDEASRTRLRRSAQVICAVRRRPSTSPGKASRDPGSGSRTARSSTPSC
jgi:hypothetical protein